MEKQTEISQEELEQILSQDEKIVRVVNRILTGEYWLSLEERKFEECYFVDCKIERGVHVRLSGDRHCGFIGCEIAFGLQIHKPSHAVNDYPELGLHSSKIERLIIGESEFSNIRMFECVFKEVLIDKSIVYGKSFTILNCTMQDDLEIKNSHAKTQIRLDGVVVHGSVSFEDLVTPVLYLTRCLFKDDFDTDRCTFNLEFDRITVDGTTIFYDANHARIKIEGSTFNKVAGFEFSDQWEPYSTLDKKRNYLIEYLGIISTSFPGGFDVGIDWEENQRLPVERIEIICTSATKGDVFFSNLEIGTCTFKGMNRDASFHFLDSSITESLMLFQFVNHGRIVVNELLLERKTQVHMNRAVLGPAHFTAVDFSKTEGFHFYESDISTISFTSVKWPMKVNAYRLRGKLMSIGYWKKYFYDHWLKLHWHNLKVDDDEVVYYFNRKELYRQLKSAAEKMQDRVLALEFQSIEMTAYSKVLQLTRKMFDIERIILFLGRTNEYGQNWWRPVCLALITTAIFYVPIAVGVEPGISLFSANTEPGRSWIEVLVSRHDIFPKLLNPVHSLEHLSVAPKAIHPATWWFDYIHRILMAFFIFQTVSAFRKYVK